MEMQPRQLASRLILAWEIQVVMTFLTATTTTTNNCQIDFMRFIVCSIFSIFSSVQVSNGLVSMPSATALTSNPLMTNPPQTCNPFIGADALSASSLQFLQQMQAVGLQQQLLQGANSFKVHFKNW